MRRGNLGIWIIFALTFVLPASSFGVEIPVPSIPVPPDTDRTVLPNLFPIYVKDNIASNHPLPDYQEKFLPVNNAYKLNPGCYIACYSQTSKGSVYAVSNNVFVIGNIRVAGSYNDNTCVPVAAASDNFGREKKYIHLCATSFSSCKNGTCWADGETGNWFIN